MIAAADLLDILVRSSLLVGLVWLAAAGVGRAGGSAAMRHTIWLYGVAGLVFVPILSALMPALPLAILPDGMATPGPAPMAPPIEVGATAAAVPVAATPAATIGLGDAMMLLYFAVAAGLLGRLVLGQWLLARLWKRSRPAGDPGWTETLAAACAEMGVGRAVALRIADGPAMPMTWGVLRPLVLLPGEARGWTGERRRIVLLHELAHVARQDSLGQTAATIVCALYWFNPAVWYAVRQMRREQEQACDDLVLAAGAKASVYARSLLDVALAFQTPRIGPAVAMASPSELERRLTAIIRGGSRRRAGFRFLAGCGVTALVATSLVASVVPVPAAPADLPEVPAAPPVPPAASASPSAAVAPAAPTNPVPPLLPVPAPRRLGQPAMPPSSPRTPLPLPDPAPVAAPPAADDPYAGNDYGRAFARYRRDHVV